MVDIPEAMVVCTVSVMFVQKEDGEYATVITQEGVRPFEADIVLEQAARHIQRHIKTKWEVREILMYGARHRCPQLRSSTRRSYQGGS